MAIKSNIDGVDVILEGAELEAFLAQREKDAADAQAEAEAKALALAEAKAKRDELLKRLGITDQEAKLLAASF